MHLVRFRTVADATPRVGVRTDDGLAPLPVGSAAELWRLPIDELRSLTESVTPQPIPPDVAWLPPVDGRTEVWAAGVTYLRSRDARVQESRQQSVYEQVYDAGRPELFYKAAAWRVVTDGEPVAIRTDSTDDVPEPELAVVFGAHGGILGYLVCNDMSSRSIEGENPLYLPQAKIYAGSCALSSGVRPAWEVDASRSGGHDGDPARGRHGVRGRHPHLAACAGRSPSWPNICSGRSTSPTASCCPPVPAWFPNSAPGWLPGTRSPSRSRGWGASATPVVSRPEVFVGLADGVRPQS